MDNRPLEGKRIVLTRAPEQAQEMIHALEILGAEVFLLPMVEFAPPEDWRHVDDALHKLSGFDAILFLSGNAVRYLFNRCRQLAIRWEAEQSPMCMVAAVGQGTAQAIASEGLRVDFVARNQTGEALVRELGDRMSGKKVLLPRSDRGDEGLSNALRGVGARLTEVVAYRTTAPEGVDTGMLSRVRGGEVDAIIFASPSAFHVFSDCIGADEAACLSTRVKFAALGPTTASAIRSAGAHVEIEASESSVSGICNALASHYLQRPAKVKPA
jgi:uroporphyrinogen-III synthase